MHAFSRLHQVVQGSTHLPKPRAVPVCELCPVHPNCRYEDNGDAVNNLVVIVNDTDKKSISEIGDQEKFLNSVAYLFGKQAYSGEHSCVHCRLATYSCVCKEAGKFATVQGLLSSAAYDCMYPIGDRLPGDPAPGVVAWEISNAM